MATYSWPESSWIASITLSVTARRCLAPGRLIEVLIESQRLADPDRDAAGPRKLLPRRQHSQGPEHRHRDDRHACVQGEPADSRSAPVQPPVGRPGSLWVDAEQRALVEQAQGSLKHLLSRSRTRPVHRQLLGRAKVRANDPVGGALSCEVLGLSRERDRPVEQQRQVERVEDRDVVRGQDRRARRWHVLFTCELGSGKQVQARADDEPRKLVFHPILPVLSVHENTSSVHRCHYRNIANPLMSPLSLVRIRRLKGD